MQSVFTCYAVPDKTNGTVTETWILPFYFYSTFPWARETIKSNVKLNASIKKYPTPLIKSHLNTTRESRYWSETAFAFTYYVATCILVIFYSFNVIDSNKHIFMGSTVGFLLLQCSSGVVRHPRDLQVSVATRFCRVLIFASSQYLSVIYLFHVMIH